MLPLVPACEEERHSEVSHHHAPTPIHLPWLAQNLLSQRMRTRPGGFLSLWGLLGTRGMQRMAQGARLWTIILKMSPSLGEHAYDDPRGTDQSH